MPAPVKFTPPQREAVLASIEGGQSIKDACLAVGVAQRTVNDWVRKGKELADGSDMAVFAQRFEVAKIRQQQKGLSQEDLVKLLEGVAREKRSVRAIELLLCEPWKRSKDLIQVEEPVQPKTMADELAERRQQHSG